MPKHKPERLFLDDRRQPIDAYHYTKLEMFLEEWTVVKNYTEFIMHIIKHGLPKIISFDHDLANSHYTPEELWQDYNKSKSWQERQVHSERTGYDCAKWLTEYCLENSLTLCDFYCHSMNPVGKDNINNHLLTYKNYEIS